MDDLDRQILAILRDNARESFTAIAERLGTSEGTIRGRMKRLVDDGTIRQFTIRTSGAHVKALVEVKIHSNVNAGELASTIRKWPGVEAVWEVTGENDLVVVGDLPTPGHLNDLIDKVRGLQGIDATRSRLILKEH